MLKKLFRSSRVEKPHPDVVVVVSGLPRSGTSMMMKMLADGGLEVVTDNLRSADQDNPNGYFELEPVKQLTTGQPHWLANSGGKVVKIISSLLEYLPREYQYKIIFMERDLQEVLASQQKMLVNRQEQSQVADLEMYRQFEEHLKAVKYWLARQPNMEVLFVSYNHIVSEPTAYIEKIAKFTDLPLNVENMLSTPDPSLYRNRARKL